MLRWMVVMLGLLAGGCAVGPTVPVQTMLQHRALIDWTGLASERKVEPVHASGSPPVGWDRLVTMKSALYTHEQWRSPSTATAVGVIYARLPIPLSADALRWFAKREYRKATTRPSTRSSKDNAESMTEWRDAIGRPWFDGENSKYHVRGYLVVNGLDAWFVYSGFRLDKSFHFDELSVAHRSAETFVPVKGS